MLKRYKKYIWLFGITALLFAAFWWGGNVLQSQTVAVTVRVLQPQTVEQTVVCSGKLEKAGNEAQAVSTGTSVQVRIAVPENRLKAVQVGQRVTVSGTAFAAKRYSGTLISLGDTAYTTVAGTTVLDGVVVLDATDKSLKCGLTAKVGICVDESEGLLLPYSSLAAAEDGTEFVYVAENGRAVRRDVTVSEELADGVLVTAGVTAGEKLILHAEDVPQDGARVTEALE